MSTSEAVKRFYVYYSHNICSITNGVYCATFCSIVQLFGCIRICSSKLCLPHLKKSSNPHILNISPPLNMKPIWFKNHCGELLETSNFHYHCYTFPHFLYLYSQLIQWPNMACQCVYWEWQMNLELMVLQSMLFGPKQVICITS